MKFTDANCCPLCRPNDHPDPRFQGCLVPSASEGKLFALSLKLYLLYVENYTLSTVSHIFSMSAAVTNCITDGKSDLCTSYSDLSLSSDIRSVVATPPRLDAGYHTKYLTVLGCGNAKNLGVAKGMMCGFVGVQHAAAFAAAAGKPDDIELLEELYNVLSKVPGTTLPASYSLAVEMMNDEVFGAAELARAWKMQGTRLGNTWGPINGLLGKADFYDSDKKAALGRLMKEKPDRDREVAMQLADAEAAELAAKRKANRAAGGKSTGGKPRGKRRKLEDQEKANRAKENAAGKAARQVAQAKRWLCRKCNWGCTHGNRAAGMQKHLKASSQCRVCEDDYISSFRKDGWE